MKKETAKELKKGDSIFYAGAIYEVAETKEFPHALMIGIYDETESKHIDYLNYSDVREALPCYACQGGGCPVCGGTGFIIY